ncbi:unnamed protein product [Phytomonas sp. EM1]|nr:unnamed protein product [Phytomonas sp. EM1]|eukprot:CCW61000.1 unnamed protein product [Phytomonas sp. isolate EM1]
MEDCLVGLAPALDSYDLFSKSDQQPIGQYYDNRYFPKLIFRGDGDETEHQESSPCDTSSARFSNESSNLLSYLYSYFCQKHGVSNCSSDVQERLSQPSESIASAFLVVGAFLQRVRVPHLTVLNFDRCYFGGRQLMALADLLGVSYKTGDHTTTSGGSLHARNFSLVPYLSKLSVRDAKLNYYNNEDDQFDLHLSKSYDYSVVSGNDAFGYFFRALRGHPSLTTLDVSENPIGPFLFTHLVRLVKTTPFLTAIHLERTLLSIDEVQIITAHCCVNERRQAKSLPTETGDDPLLSDDRTERNIYAWVLALRKWVVAHQNSDNDLVEEVLWHRSSDDLIMHGIVSETRSPFITMECVTEKMLKAYSQLKSSAIKTSTSFLSVSQDANLFSYSDEYTTTEQNKPLSTLSYSSKSPSLEGFPSFWESLSHVLYTPYFLYYLPNESPLLWSPESIDALRSAFVDPVRAYNTFLGGRPVPRGVPRPLKPSTMASDAAATPEERRSLLEAIGHSALMRKAFLQLLPPPPKPISHFEGFAETNPQYRTVAEENYYFVCDKQKKQRELLLNKIVDSLELVSYRVGDVLYKEGGEPSCLFFIPPSALGDRQSEKTMHGAAVQVRLEYTLVEETANAMLMNPIATPVEGAERTKLQSLVYEEGDFVGELEVLGGVGCQPSRIDSMVSPIGARCTPSQHLLELQVQKYRFSTARVQARGDDGSAGGPVRLWQLPMQAAFFFLHQPFQQIYHRATAIFEYFPALSRLSPIATLAFAYAVEPFAVELSRQEIFDGSTARVIADNRLVSSHIYLLAKGEYTFSTYTALGSWIDKILFSGSVVVSGSAHRDAKMDPEISSHVADTSSSASNVVLGKAIALRQFREAKRWKQRAEASALKTDSTLDESDPMDSREARKERNDGVTEGKEGLSSSRTPPSPGDQRLLLDVLDAGGEENVRCQWKYYVISNTQFSSFPKEVKLAILSSCAIVTS